MMSSNKFGATTLAGILLTCMLYLNTATSQAQESAAAAPAKQPSQLPDDSAARPSPATSGAHTQRARSIYPRHTIDDRVKELTKALDLNETQQSGVKTVLERQVVQIRRIQFDPGLSGADRNGRFRALQQDTVLRIRALLDEEQKKKFDPLNHGTQNTSPSQSYVDQWMKHHQQTTEQPAPPSQE